MSEPLRVLPTDDDRRARPARPPAEPPASWEQEREQLLSLLIHQQRVAQAGLVTSGLAHDVNNHVQIMSGTAYLALMSDRPQDLREALEKIQQQCRDITETTRTFLSFVRRRDEEVLATFQLSTLVDSVCRMLGPLATDHGVALHHSIAEDVQVRGELRLAVQALVNLASNAIRACSESGGNLSIDATCPAEGFTRIEVSDDGPGIPEHVRRRLFRPFATGSADKGGNGLGLFIVRQTVRTLGGSIRVRTSPEGTTFVLDLPRA